MTQEQTRMRAATRAKSTCEVCETDTSLADGRVALLHQKGEFEPKSYNDILENNEHNLVWVCSQNCDDAVRCPDDRIAAQAFVRGVLNDNFKGLKSVRFAQIQKAKEINQRNKK